MDDSDSGVEEEDFESSLAHSPILLEDHSGEDVLGRAHRPS